MTDGSDDGRRLPGEVVEAVRRHADQPELAVYSLQVWAHSQPDWPDSPAVQAEAVGSALEDLPVDVIDAEGRAAFRNEVAGVYQCRDG